MTVINEFKFNKELFIREVYPKIKKSTAVSYDNLLDGFFGMSEVSYKRDLFDFSEIELNDAIEKGIGKNKDTLYKLNSLYPDYIRWGRKHFNSEPQYGIIDIHSLDISKKFIEKANENMFKGILTRKQLESIINEKIYNKQDKALILLQFESIKGIEACDLLGLQVSQIDGRWLSLKERKILIPSLATSIIQKAIDEKIYKDGNGKGKSNKGPTYLKNTGFVFKSEEKSLEDHMIRSTYGTRMYKFKGYSGVKDLTANGLYKSGIFDYLMLIESRKGNGKITTDDAKRVCQWFGEHPTTNNNYYECRKQYEEYKKWFNINDYDLQQRRENKNFDEIYEMISNITPESTELIIYNEDETAGTQNDTENLIDNNDNFEYHPNKQQGDKGEKHVIAYLKRVYPSEPEPDHVALDKTVYPGYDIRHDRNQGTEHIEVKATTHNNPVRVFLTYNELEAAIKLGDEYSFYIVYYKDEDENEPEAIYQINNPVSLFGITDVESIMYKINKPSILMLKAQHFLLKFELEFLKHYELI